MCTAVSFLADAHYFGRNLDLAYSYHETVTVTPRALPLAFRNGKALSRHHAMIGMAYVQQGYALYYDAVNENGLAMAGLRFAQSAVYRPAQAERDNVASFELIPWVLGQCATLAEARSLLRRVNITDESFSGTLPHTPLHWMVADRTGSFVVEQTAQGLQLHDDPVGVLTNEPPFPTQMWNLANYMGLSAGPPQNKLAAQGVLRPYSGGMGAMGLPGDMSSVSRFVRAVFLRRNSVCGEEPYAGVSGFFRILDGVAQVKGCVREADGLSHTVYSACCDTDRGVYYYKTYTDSRIAAVDLFKEDVEGTALVCYPLASAQDILMQN